MGYYCERCGTYVKWPYGGGRFCSRSCANKRIHSEKTKIKISNSMKKQNEEKSKLNTDKQTKIKNNQFIVCNEYSKIIEDILVLNQLFPNDTFNLILNARRYLISNRGIIFDRKFKKIYDVPIYSNGYKEAYIEFDDGSKKVVGVHRLVASCFIDNPNNLPLVNHKDENPLNNNADNLEWCDHSYNTLYSIYKRKYVYHEPWNKGLNKYTDERVMKYSNTLKTKTLKH